MAKEQAYDETQEESSVVEIKVSDDQGQTWQRRKIDFGKDLDESGLNVEEIFQLKNGEKYEVIAGEGGLQVKPMAVAKKSNGKKK